MSYRLVVSVLLAAVFALPAFSWSQERAAKPQAKPTAVPLPPTLPGLQAGGKILLPTQWSLKPAGTQIKLGDFPVNIALHPKEPWAAVLHCGYGDHEIVIVDLKTQKITSRVVLDQAFYGLCFDPDGKQLFASGAEYEVVHQFAFDKGYLSDHRTSYSGNVADKNVPGGLACSPDGKTLFIAQTWGDKVALVKLGAMEPPAHVDFEAGSYPYTVLPTRDGKRLYVSEWGRATVGVIDLAGGKRGPEWPTELHPTEMALSPKEDILYVACANSNQVTVIDTATGKALETISSALHPQAHKGSTPNSLSLSADGKVLLIANADNNNIAMFNVSERGKSRSMGFIPAGWYPTSVRFSTAGDKIYVANGKGLMSKGNAQGPNPLKPLPRTVDEYIGGLFRGTLSVIDVPSPAAMAEYSKTAYECSPLRADNGVVVPPRDADNPIPKKVGDPSPIKHCLYIIKENRTYDQVFGDIPEGNGDASLCIFPDEVTPNHHALVRQYVLLDNFYVESEVSADGHEWSMGAYATDFVEKTWPLSYRGGKGKLTYPAEGSFNIAQPAGGYIWDRCLEAKVSYRSYGEFIANAPNVGEPAKARVKTLDGHFDPLFRGYDLDYPDMKRAARFIEELKGYEQTGDLPQFIVLRLPNDHTFGQRAGKPTPTAMVAENDLALGTIVEAVSRSKFWKETAIFIVEDDAQNGSDHVDAHRTVALVISPYTKKHFVDSSMYSTASMLRTMELILGLKPMSQFDAAALPMHAAFQSKSDLAPYARRPARVDIAAKNAQDAWGAALSQKLDFSKEDAADDLLLNEIVWKSVRGPKSRMPPPVRAPFVFAVPEKDDDDDD